MKAVDLSSDAALKTAVLGVVILCGAVAAAMRQPALLAVLAIPIAGVMLTNFRAVVLITTWVLLLWLSRLLVVLYDFVLLSYLVYACIAVALAAFALRIVTKRTPLALTTNPWLVLFVLAIVGGGIHGLNNVDRIPPWLLVGDSVADYSTGWVYFRDIVLPGLLLPVLAVLVAAAIAERQPLSRILMPVGAVAVATATLIVKEVLTSSQSLLSMAQADERNEHLTSLGFHSNELGTTLAIAYALLLGARDGCHERRTRIVLAFVLGCLAIALLFTFSRGAYFAFGICNALYFVRASTSKKVIWAVAVTAILLLAPAAVFNRAAYALDTKDANEISAGRVDKIWMPLLPDIGQHLWFGQGLHSIMWTDAQRFQEIYPVTLSHNAYLDLILDFGVLGALPIVAWYIYLWRGFRAQARIDPNPRFRCFFFGAYLSLISLAVCGLMNDRLTPTATNAFIWVAAGILLGRKYAAPRERRQQAVRGIPMTLRTPVPMMQHAVTRRAMWSA
jgi:O-antigen ligase